MEAIKYFFAIVLDAGVAVLFAKMLAACIKGFLKNRRSNVESIEATVSSKTCDAGSSEVGENGLRSGKSLYTAVFKTNDGGTCDFALTKEEYEALNEGDFGVLSFRGRNFLNFEPDRLMGSADNE